MRLDKSQLYMVSTMRPSENMEIQTHGNIALKSLITLALGPSLKEKSSASMVACHQRLEHLIKSE